MQWPKLDLMYRVADPNDAKKGQGQLLTDVTRLISSTDAMMMPERGALSITVDGAHALSCR
jgi:hypothetical protein